MSELNIKVRKSQDNGSTFRATPDTLYMGGVGSAKVDTLHFEVPEEWAGCAITLHVQRLSGALPDPQMLDENNCESPSLYAAHLCRAITSFLQSQYATATGNQAVPAPQAGLSPDAAAQGGM